MSLRVNKQASELNNALELSIGEDEHAVVMYTLHVIKVCQNGRALRHDALQVHCAHQISQFVSS